jgi:hypothetical protein
MDWLGEPQPGNLRPHHWQAVRFEVARQYKGESVSSVVVRTGKGRGDCGFPFKVGFNYLVYAYSDAWPLTYTDICSRTIELPSAYVEIPETDALQQLASVDLQID